MNLKEHLQPVPGFAIVGRWVYDGVGDDRRLIGSDTYYLLPGKGILFSGEADMPQEAIKFSQAELGGLLANILPGTLQLIAIVEQETGGLLFTDLRKSGGIGRPTPPEKRVMVANYGRLSFAGIWGETEEEASGRLKELQALRAG